jgi:hypothetical protein
MGVIKVESFDVDVTATNTQTHVLSNDVGSLNNAFVRRTTSIDKQSGPTASTGNSAPNICSGAAFLSATNQISFRQNTTTSQKIIGEVWRYTGAVSGPDEFIVRGRYSITLSSGSAAASQVVTGISDRNKCIPFWTGSETDATSVDDYDSSTVSVYIDATDTIQVERGATTGTLVVYITVVEFVGANFSVGHGRSASHNSTAETITLNADSTGLNGLAFDVGSWGNAIIIESSLEGDTSETGISDNLGVWVPDSTTQAQFILQQDSNARNDGVAYCHVLSHPAFVINRDSNTNISEGNGTYATNATWPSGSSTSALLDELSLEWFSDTSGVGTAHARGRLSARITAASGTIEYWVHRSGNNVRADWGVLELTGIDGTLKLSISDVDGDNAIGNSQLNVVVNSSGGFEALQGTGKVELVQNSDYSGVIVNQTNIDSWSDTVIQFDVTSGSLADTDCFLFVTTDSGSVASISVVVGTPPETYREAVLNMTLAPDHYWTFQNTYIDEVQSATANNSIGGSPGFDATTQLVKGDTHSFLISSQTEYISPADQSDMNVTITANRRYVGGWIMLSNISQNLYVIWEEGAQVNNFALLGGFGNNLIFQFADANGDYAQAFFDIALTPNRPYHILGEFNSSTQKGGICGVHLDGVFQSRTNGNPWEVSVFPTHSGNISWGHEGTEDLKVGDDRGVDATVIEFVSPTSCWYAHWYSWSNTSLDNTLDIRQTLFEKGAPAEVTISSDTQANMQLAVDAIANSNFPDWPCSIEVQSCTDGDFSLTMDNVTFNDRVSIQIRYIGSDVLTLTAATGTIIDDGKVATPYGGTVTVLRPATLIINGVIDGAEVRIYDDEIDGDGQYNTELDGVESNAGTFFSYSHNGTINGIRIQHIATGYVEINLPFNLQSTNQSITLQPQVETNE